MYKRFEKLIDPFERTALDVPPKGFWAFCWYYTKPVWPILAAVSLFGTLVALLEVYIFTFLGDLVTWLENSDPDTFFDENWPTLLFMLGIVLVLRPLLEAAWQLMFHQGLMGTYPMSIRWRVHRYLLRQSISFYQNDFAGRIATKLMQTALGVREVISRMADIMVYVSVYFTAAVFVVAGANLWMGVPFLVWVGAYVLTIRYFIPKLQTVSKQQADARSVMTGHVVDAYTNITTVKLFSHAEREEAYAKSSMMGFLKTVFVQMRLVTALNLVLVFINMLLLTAVGGLSIFLWQAGTATLGEVTIAIAFVLRLQGMSHWILWELAGLFENIGTVQDGIATISREREVTDVENAAPLTVSSGAIKFENVRFHYGKKQASLNSWISIFNQVKK